MRAVTKEELGKANGNQTSASGEGGTEMGPDWSVAGEAGEAHQKLVEPAENERKSPGAIGLEPNAEGGSGTSSVGIGRDGVEGRPGQTMLTQGA